MGQFAEQMSNDIRGFLVPGEVVLGAAPVGVRSVRSDVRRDQVSGRISGTTAAVVEASVELNGAVFTDKMVLVATDQRLLVFEQRRWRMRPGRYLNMVRLDSLGNVEGVHASSRGSSVFELILIMADGAAATLEVPSAFESDAKELVRRLQARLRS